MQGPLVLHVTTGRSEGKIGFAISQRHRGRQRCSRSRTWAETVRQAILEPEHLTPRTQAEAELRDGWRTLQPAAAWCCRHHQTGAVDGIDVAGIAGLVAADMCCDRGFTHS